LYDVTTGVDLGSVALASGLAVLNTASLPVGSNSVTLSYSGDSNFQPSATSVSVSVGSSILVLNPTAENALQMSGNSVIAENGPVFVDSSSATAIQLSGNAQISASQISEVGGYLQSGNAAFHPTPVTGSPAVADPWATLAAPAGVCSGEMSAWVEPHR
jgi:hypothetical protein